MPFADDSFDAVLSTFGVMFTPNQEQSAAELRARVPSGRAHRPRRTGRPTASSARCSRSSGRYVAPPAGIRSPLEWGTEARLTELLGVAVSKLADPPQGVRLPLPLGRGLGRHVPRVLRPDAKAFGALDAAAQNGLEQDLLMLAREHNTSDARAARSERVLEVVATV